MSRRHLRLIPEECSRTDLELFDAERFRQIPQSAVESDVATRIGIQLVGGPRRAQSVCHRHRHVGEPHFSDRWRHGIERNLGAPLAVSFAHGLASWGSV